MINKRRTYASFLAGALFAIVLTTGGADAQPMPTDTDVPLQDPATADNPAVAAVLGSDPQSPVEWLQSALTLTDLEQPELAKAYLKKLLDARLDAAQLAALARQFGSADLMKLVLDKSVAPEGQSLAQAAMQAAARQAQDPQRLAQLVLQLGDPAAEVRRAAMTDLVQGRSAAAVVCVAALADSQQASRHVTIRQALVEMGPAAVGPLSAAIESGDEQLAVQAIEVLGVVGDARTVPLLLGTSIGSDKPLVRDTARRALEKMLVAVPTAAAAESLLWEQTRLHLRGHTAGPAADHLGGSEIWVWDPGTKRPAALSGLQREAQVVQAVRLARDLLTARPQQSDYQIAALVAQLEAAKMGRGVDQPLPHGPGTAFRHALDLGPRGLERALDQAMNWGLWGAATGAAELLGEVGDLDTLTHRAPKPSPLIRGLACGDQRVQLAAAGAMMQLDPDRPYPGSSQLARTLRFLGTSRGVRQAVIADPRVTAARELAGMLVGLEYEAEVVTEGRSLATLAAHSPDVEFVLVAATIDGPGLRDLLYLLRADPRTRRLPVGLIASDAEWKRAERVAREDPLVEAFPRPSDLPALQRVIAQLAARLDGRGLSAQQRQQHAAQAEKWLAQWAAMPKRSRALGGLRTDPL